MDLPANLRCLFTATVEEQDGSYVLSIPDREVQLNAIHPGETVRVALLPAATDSDAPAAASPAADQEGGGDEPPVAEGEQRTVEIEDIGEQGDGIARVERGYVIIVPDTEMGERVTIEITQVRENVAFGEVIDRDDYYE